MRVISGSSATPGSSSPFVRIGAAIATRTWRKCSIPARRRREHRTERESEAGDGLISILARTERATLLWRRVSLRNQYPASWPRIWLWPRRHGSAGTGHELRRRADFRARTPGATPLVFSRGVVSLARPAHSCGEPSRTASTRLRELPLRRTGR